MRKKVIVIGAGITGLAVAALLGKDGYDVIVLEKNQTIGGRGRQYKEGGFTFDMGPSWYMMPDAFEKYFSLFEKKPQDFFTLKRLDTHYRVFFSDKTQYDITSDKNENVLLFEKLEPGAGNKLMMYLKKARWIYETAMKEMVFFDYNSLLPLLNPKLIADIIRFNMFSTFHTNITKYFSNPKLQKIIEFTTVFLGGSPYNTPAFYSLITHTDFNLGIWYPMGGIFVFIQALESLCVSNKVRIVTRSPVISLEVSNKTITNVHTENKTYAADIVVNSADYRFTETHLLEKKYQTYPDTYWKNKIMSPSAFCIYLGIKGKIKNLSHHNLYFDNSWEQHFQEVYAKRKRPQHPSYYVHVPSKTDPSVAPKNCDALFILVPVAADLSDTDSIRKNFSDRIIAHLEQMIGDAISHRIVVKKIFSHRDFIADYNGYKGAAFGLAHTLFQSALFRPLNKSKKVHNLYYVGQYTNPGVGMPTGLISSQIVHNLIKKMNDIDFAQLTKKASKTFYYASLLFPSYLRKDVFILYSFLRAGDDMVDSMPQQKKQFYAYKNETKNGILQKRKMNNPLIKAFLVLFKKYHFDINWVNAYFDSMEKDLVIKKHNISSLNTFMYGSAEVVGLMMAKIMGASSKGMHAARLLGKGMQLINFIRDIKEDEQMGRMYIPSENLQKFHINTSVSVTNWNQKQFMRLVRYKTSEALQMLKKAQKGFRYIPKANRKPIEIASNLYRWTAIKIQNNPKLILVKKIKPSLFIIIWYTLKSIL